MERPRILVADGLSEAGLRRLREVAEVEVHHGLDEPTLRACIRGTDALIVRSQTRVTSSVLQAADRLRVVARAGVGVDNVDVEAATRAGVLVLNTPEASVRAAAEHTVALLLALARHIPQANASLQRGEWTRERFVGTELYGKTLGVVGLGRIGSEVARRAQAFGMRVLAYDPYLSEERAHQLGATLVPFDVLLGESDVITLHVPLTAQTRRMIDAAALRRTKRGVRIVNCARGGLIDEEALLGALEEGHVAGAALDVFETEPPQDLRLIRHPRVVATPHLGASTREAQEAIGIEVAEQVLEALAGRLPRGAVNVAVYRAESWERIGPHLELARILGSLTRQLARGRIRSVEVRLEGELSRIEGPLLAASFLTGLLQGVVERTVNVVNAHVVASERGLRVTEVRQEHSEDFASLLLATTHTDEGTWVLGGTLFGRREPRIVRINEHTIDLAPAPHMLFVWNLDRPGMIGQVGTILGRHRVNIAGMYLGRSEPGGLAVMVLTVDEPAPPEAVEAIRRVDGIYDAKPVYL